jgi:hypothetical protein
MVLLLPSRKFLDMPQGLRAYGQVHGVIPLSCACFAAAASTKGRNSG